MTATTSPPSGMGDAPPGSARRAVGATAQFEALYRSCASDLYAYVASMLRDAAAAEDVTALAFERAYRRRARSRALLDEPADESTPAEVDDELGERRLLVRAGLAQLDAREREVILLKFVGRLSNGELARVLGCSESSAGTRLHRAIKRLREVCHAPQ